MRRSDKEQLFEELLAQNKNRIFRVCRSYFSDEQDINDVFQEILVGIWKAIERFRNDASWSTYIYRIALNTCLKYQISLRKDQEKKADLDEQYLADTEISKPEEKEEKLVKLEQCIKLLSEGDRILISMVLEDFSYKQIAEILDSDINTIGVRIHRAKQRLTELVENYNG